MSTGNRRPTRMVFAIALLSLFSLLLAGCLGDDNSSFQEGFQDFCTNATAEEQQTGLYQNNCLVAADNSAASDTNTSSGTTSNGGATSGQGTTGNSGTDTTVNGTGSNGGATGNSGTGTTNNDGSSSTGNTAYNGTSVNGNASGTTGGSTDPSGNGTCQLTRNGPWSMNPANLPFEIEAGAAGIQHLDFYPQRGVRSISYILPSVETHSVWVGFGGNWEEAAHCKNWPWEQDAIDYAAGNALKDGRIHDEGHSGIVIDLRNGRFEVVANEGNLTEAQIRELFSLHQSAMQSFPGTMDGALYFRETLATGSTEQPPVNQAGGSSCSATRNGDADDKSLVVPAGQTFVVEAWQPRNELMVFSEGQTVSGVKGALWIYSCGTDAAVAAEQAAGNNPVVQ